MKKLMLLLLALLTVALLVSCGDDTTDPSGKETTAETGDETVTDPNADQPKRMSDDEKAKYYKVVELDFPEGDFRDIVVDYMRKQASIEWVCGLNFSVSEEFAKWGIDLEFKMGQKYTGIPYADTKVSYIQFENALVDGKYTSRSSAWKDVYGVQCISSIMNCIQQFDHTVAGTSNEMMPSYSGFEAQILGGYTVPHGVSSTQEIKEANSADTIYNAYMQLKKGDIIITKDDRGGGLSHFRVLVEEPTIYKTGGGKIIPSRCTIKTIEQTNAFDKIRTDGVKTTWFVDHIYSFSSLYEKHYLPLTLASYSKSRSEMEVPYILLDKEINSETLAKGTFNITSVKSNFPIRYVQIDILNKEGQSVHSAMVMDMEDTRSVPLRNHASKVFDALKSGDYTMVVSAGIARGSTELARVDFTYTAK